MQIPQSPIQRSISPLKEPVADSEPTIEALRSFSKPPSSKEKVNNWHPYNETHTTNRSSVAASRSKASVPAPSPSDRPTVPYAQLISEAIDSTATKRITLNGIYNYVIDNYPYFQTASVGWKNSVRHNLSLNKNFIRVPRPPMEKGKGAYWTLSTEKHESKAASSSGTTSRRQPKAAPAVVSSPHIMESHLDHMEDHHLNLNPYLDVQTFEFQYEPVETFPSTTFESLYQNANTAFISDESFVSTSQQTFSNLHQEDFEAIGNNGSVNKGMYLDQFERMLAIEQMRQSSQASIETFQTYEGCESNAFFENSGSDVGFGAQTTTYKVAPISHSQHGRYHQQVDYEYVPEHDSSIFLWNNGGYDSYLGGDRQ